MNNELANFYFLKALESAKQANLTKAVEYLAISLGLHQDYDEASKLAGLCYYRLGNYVMAEQCFNQSSYYKENIEERLLKKQDEFKKINQMVESRQYKNAIKYLENIADKNVNEYNYLGCLYAVIQKKEKAINSFSVALSLDNDNEKTLLYLRNIQNLKKKWWWS